MLVTTTDAVEGRRIKAYLGVVSGETVYGANVFRDFFASIRDVIGVDLDYESIGQSMPMVSANGIAVRLE
jgi:uncharacterized protein YbjQ (UPF0145 family)